MIVEFKDLIARREAARVAGDRIARDAFDLMIAFILGEPVLECYSRTNPTLRSVRTGEALEW